MPFKSKAQRRLFWAKVNQGEISEDKAREWERETVNKDLPEHVTKKEAAMFGKYAYYQGTVDALVTIGTITPLAKLAAPSPASMINPETMTMLKELGSSAGGGALLGGGIGGATGAMAADEGHGWEGAARGAGMGALAGGLATPAMSLAGGQAGKALGGRAPNLLGEAGEAGLASLSKEELKALPQHLKNLSPAELAGHQTGILGGALGGSVAGGLGGGLAGGMTAGPGEPANTKLGTKMGPPPEGKELAKMLAASMGYGAIPGGALGAGAGAMMAPEGHRLEGAGKGGLVGAGLGALSAPAGLMAGAVGGRGLSKLDRLLDDRRWAKAIAKGTKPPGAHPHQTGPLRGGPDLGPALLGSLGGLSAPVPAGIIGGGLAGSSLEDDDDENSKDES